MTDDITHTFDVANINWDFLDAIADTRPEKLRRLREGIRQHLIDVGQHCGSTRLVAWAMNARPEALDRLNHVGFLESNLWEMLTAKQLTEEVCIRGRLAFDNSSRPVDEQEQAEQFTADEVAELANEYGAKMTRIDLPEAKGWKLTFPRPAHDGQNRTGGKP